MRKIASHAVSLACVLLMVWFIWSWLEIGFHNSQPNPQYSEYNVIVMLARG